MVYAYILFGVIIGATISCAIFMVKHRSLGTLRIDHSNPETDKYRFDIPNLDILDHKRRISLKVDNHADLSHE